LLLKAPDCNFYLHTEVDYNPLLHVVLDSVLLCLLQLSTELGLATTLKRMMEILIV